MPTRSPSLADYFVEPAVTPGFFLKRGGWARKWIQSFASLADLTFEGARQASLCDSPADTPDDALDYIGRDSDIERNPNEADPAYRLRLIDRFETHERGARAGVDGYRSGIALALVPLGHEDVRALDLGHGWVFDDNVSNPWRFWVLILQPHPWAPLVLGDDVVLGDLVLGITMPLTILRQMRRLVRKWKSAHGIGVDFIIVFSGFVLAEDIDLSDSTVIGGDAVNIPIGHCVGHDGFDSLGDGTVIGYWIDPF